MKALNVLFFVMTIFFSFTVSGVAELKLLDKTEVEVRKKTIKRIISWQSKVSKALHQLALDVGEGGVDSEYKLPEEDIKIIKQSINGLKMEVIIILELMKGYTFDTWDEDKKAINLLSRKLKHNTKKLKHIVRIHYRSHEE